MNFTVVDCAQRTQEWAAARLGRLTASRAADMLSRIKSGEPAAGCRHLKTQLVLERLTGRSQENGYQSQAMKDGIEREPDALLLYEALTGQIVTRTGFLKHTTLMAGASLDGHVGDFELLIEAKCPLASTHLEFLETGRVPGEYEKQIRHELWLTGAPAADFLSYCPDFPESLQARIVRVTRDEKAIAEYEKEATTFLADIERKLETLLTLTNLRGTLAAAVA